LKIVKNIEELKQSVEEKASAIKKAEEGAADLKNRVEELSKSLEEHEKEYQVKEACLSVGFYYFIGMFYLTYCSKLLIGRFSWQEQR
jgi:hypothetical protein